MERQRKNVNGKEEKQDERGRAEQLTPITRGARTEESQQKPRRDRPKKRARKSANGRPRLSPKFRQEKQEQYSTGEGHPKRDSLKNPYAVRGRQREQKEELLGMTQESK